MNGTRETFRRAAAGLLAAYLALVLVLNHTMLTNDHEGMRVWFYLLVASVPTGLVGVWRILSRTHRGEEENEATEGPILFLIAVGFAGVVWGVSTLFY